jgi:hypothetical protein
MLIWEYCGPKTSQSLQQGIRIGIQFAGTSPSNSRKEVNQSPNEVGKEEDPQIEPIQHENQLSGHTTRGRAVCTWLLRPYGRNLWNQRAQHGVKHHIRPWIRQCWMMLFPSPPNPDQQQTPNGILEGPRNAGSKKASRNLGQQMLTSEHWRSGSKKNLLRVIPIVELYEKSGVSWS